MPPQDIQGRSYNILDPRDEFDVDPEIAVPSQGVVRSNSFFLLKGHTYAFEVQFDSDVGIDAKVELEQQFEDGDDFVIPDNKVDFPMFEQIVDSNTHIVAYAPIATLNGRLKITGLSGNDASTALIKAKMYTAKNYG